MKTVTLHQAKAHLSSLLNEVEAGEEIVVTRHGRPVARILAVGEPRRPRQAGAWRSSPAWDGFVYDHTVVAPLTEAELEAEGWNG